MQNSRGPKMHESSDHDLGASGTTASAPAHAFRFLMQPEIRFIDAAVARLIPADELGPGAREAGVTHFLDQPLPSSWGTHSRHYRSPASLAGTARQWVQSRLVAQRMLPTVNLGRHD